MKRCWGWVIACQTLLLGLLDALNCPPNTACTCQRTRDDWRITCTDDGLHDTILWYKPRTTYLEVNCETGGTVAEGTLRALAFHRLSSVDFRSCPLPAVDYGTLVGGYNVTGLWIKAAVNRPITTLNSSILHGLSSLRRLSLQECGLMELPADLLRNTPNLVAVIFRGNKLTSLPLRLFAATRQLEVLDLGANQFVNFTTPFVELTNLTTLHLFNNDISVISRDAFGGTRHIKVLELQGNHLETLPDNVFNDLPDLEEISLFSNALTQLPRALFAETRNLVKVYLQDNALLQDLPEDLFWNQTRLGLINLSMCNFSVLPPALFRGLSNLTTLDVSSNRLSFLDAKLFANCYQLQVLKLDHNSLVGQLPSNFFRNNRQLTSLYLHHNYITTLPDETFRNQRHLKTLDISHNWFITLDVQLRHLVGLESLSIAYNNLSHVDMNAFASCDKLMYLDLSYNQLETPYFDLPRNATKVNLAHNVLNVMPADWESLWMLQSINLSYNQIFTLSVGNLMYESTVEIDLQHNALRAIDMNDEHYEKVRPLARLGFNPLHCNCGIRSLLLHMTNQKQDHDVMVNFDIEHLRCASPSSLQGRAVKHLTEQDLFCHVKNTCPTNCMCLFYVSGDIMEVRCSGLGLTEVPTMAPPNTTTLDLSDNAFTTLKGLEHPRWSQLTVLILTGNNLSSLEVEYLPKTLTALFANRNSIAKLHKNVTEYLLNNPQLQIKLSLNPWFCNCSDRGLQEWVRNSNNIIDYQQMKCSNKPNATVGHYQCPEASQLDTSHLMVGLVVFALLFSLLMVAAAIAYYKYMHRVRVWLYSREWCTCLISERDVDVDKQYDAFVSFSQDDCEWVAKVLLPGLEQNEPYYRLCIHHRDWLAGEWISDQIVRSVEASCRTIVVLSQNFLRSVWGRMEFKAAYHQALKDRMNRVIIVILDDNLPSRENMDPDMRMYVDLNTYLRWGDPWFWKKLRYAMPHHSVRRSSDNTETSFSDTWFTSVSTSSSSGTDGGSHEMNSSPPQSSTC